MPNAHRISRSIPMPLVPPPTCPKCLPRTASVSKSPPPPAEPSYSHMRAAYIVCTILHTNPFRLHHATPHAYIPSRSDCPRAGNALGHSCAGAIGNCRKEDASHRLLGPFHLKPAISKALSSLDQRSTAAVCRNLAGQVDRFIQLCFHLAHLGIDFVL